MKKTFLSSISAFGLAILAITISQAFSSLPVASAATNVWPEEIVLSGHTSDEGVTLNGVNNSGIINFDEPGVEADYKARFVRIGDGIDDNYNNGDPVYTMEGWGWNDNLGWVSFYCNGGENRTASCGDQDYEIKLIKKTDINGDPYLSFTGYAWNDATGYISMNSSNHIPPISEDKWYGLKMDKNGQFKDEYTNSTQYVWAWSDSIGWINFAGVKGDLKILTLLGCEDEDYVGVCPEICDSTETNCDSDISSAMVGEFPVADGFDKYKITLKFKDENGNSIPKDSLIDNYDLRIFIKWTDTVKRDQLEGGSIAVNSLTYFKAPISTSESIGAILYKPVFLYNITDSSSGFDAEIEPPSSINTNNSDVLTKASLSGKAEWDSNGNLVLSVKSLAPTSRGNKSKIISSGTKNIYKDNDPGINGEKNNLKLESINWIMIEKSTNRKLKGGTPCGGLELNFRPAIEVSTFNTVSTDNENKDTLVLYRNVPTKLEVRAESRKTIKETDVKDTDWNIDIGDQASTTVIGLTQPSTIAKFRMQYGWIVPTQNGIGTTFSEIIPPPTIFKDWKTSRNLAVLATVENTAADYTEGIMIRSKVAYSLTDPITFTPHDIQYYSNHLPRTEANIANPVAVVQGTVYGSGSTTQEGVSINGVGDNNVNIVKDTIYENVKKLVRDLGATDATNPINIGSNLTCSSPCKTINIPKGATNPDETILYIKGNDAIIGGDTTWTGNKVIVVDGGNLYIKGNLYNESGTPKLGLVVIRNQGEDLDEAGSIYVSPNVTNIQAFAVAWGAIFSYGEGNGSFEADGRFAWDDESVMVEELSKQLIWQGGISSNNTIGGADTGGNYYKTGYKILEKNDANLLEAKSYDLNYFRYFRKKLQYDTDPITGEEVAKDTNGDGTVDFDDMVADEDKKALGASEKDTNPFYVKYGPPYSKSVIFGKEKSLTF